MQEGWRTGTSAAVWKLRAARQFSAADALVEERLAVGDAEALYEKYHQLWYNSHPARIAQERQHIHDAATQGHPAAQACLHWFVDNAEATHDPYIMAARVRDLNGGALFQHDAPAFLAQALACQDPHAQVSAYFVLAQMGLQQLAEQALQTAAKANHPMACNIMSSDASGLEAKALSETAALQDYAGGCINLSRLCLRDPLSPCYNVRQGAYAIIKNLQLRYDSEKALKTCVDRADAILTHRAHPERYMELYIYGRANVEHRGAREVYLSVNATVQRSVAALIAALQKLQKLKQSGASLPLPRQIIEQMGRLLWETRECAADEWYPLSIYKAPPPPP